MFGKTLSSLRLYVIVSPCWYVVEIDRFFQVICNFGIMIEKALLCAADEIRGNNSKSIYFKSNYILAQQDCFVGGRSTNIGEDLHLSVYFFNDFSTNPDFFMVGQAGKITVGAAYENIISSRNLASNLFSNGCIIDCFLLIEAGDDRDKGE